MLLYNTQQIKDRIGGDINGVIHVGAHLAEERNDYQSAGVERVVWIEANPALLPFLTSMPKIEMMQERVLHCVAAEVDDKEVDFNVTNNGQSSSVLQLGLHSTYYPGIVVTETLKLKTTRLDTLLARNAIETAQYEMLNIDIQGAELQALQGLGEQLKLFKAVYTEVNTAEVYKGCALLSELDAFMASHGFEREGVKMWGNDNWGDALYINRALVPNVAK
jgi:FkbM family methyltransferase